MNLTILTSELLDSAAALQAIGSYSIPDTKGSYAIAKIKRAANGALQDVGEPQRALWEKHHRKADGSFEPDDLIAFQADWASLGKEPVTLPGCRAIRLSELDGASMIVRFPDDPKHIEIVRGIPSDVLFALGPLVVEDAAPTTPQAPAAPST